jgi:hypothetical protein
MRTPLSVSLSLHLCPILITFDIEEFYSFALNFTRSPDNVDGIATGYGLDDREVEVRVLVVSRVFCAPLRPDRF